MMCKNQLLTKVKLSDPLVYGPRYVRLRETRNTTFWDFICDGKNYLPRICSSKNETHRLVI